MCLQYIRLVYSCPVCVHNSYVSSMLLSTGTNLSSIRLSNVIVTFFQPSPGGSFLVTQNNVGLLSANSDR